MTKRVTRKPAIRDKGRGQPAPTRAKAEAPSGVARSLGVKKAGRVADALPWHRPACDTCGEPILTTEGAWVCWLSDGGDRLHSPRVVHQAVEREGCYPADHRLHDHHLSYFRRSPASALEIALNGVAYKPESKAVWLRWLMTVLGLPLFDATQAALYGEAPKLLPDSVANHRFRVVGHGT